MKINRTIDGWVIAVALALLVLPLGALFSSSRGVRADSVEEAAGLSRMAGQLSKEIGKLDKRGGFEIAAHVLSVHSKIPAHELLARGAKVKKTAAAAMAARITGQSFDYVSGYLASGATVESAIAGSNVDMQEAARIFAAALAGVRYNSKNVENLALDFDVDRVPNAMDPDVDGDGLLNSEDQDIDGDGLANAADEDLDGDGMYNGLDDDTDADSLANYDDADIDADLLVNEEDGDRDGDGVADGEDSDADGDGIDDGHGGDLLPQAKGSGKHGNGNGRDDDDDDDDDDGNGNGNGNGNDNANGNGNSNGNANGNGNGNGNANGNGNGNGNGNANGNGSQGSRAAFKGVVQEMPAGATGTWRVGGRAVVVTQATRIRGAVSVGTRVKVVGFRLADGSIEASKIKKKAN